MIDAQIDVMVNQWEQSGSDLDDSPRTSRNGKSARHSKDSFSPSRSVSSTLRLSRRDYDRDVLGNQAYRDTLSRSSREFRENLLDVEADEESEYELDAMRNSLGSVLESLSESEGLSDDAYHRKVPIYICVKMTYTLV